MRPTPAGSAADPADVEREVELFRAQGTAPMVAWLEREGRLPAWLRATVTATRAAAGVVSYGRTARVEGCRAVDRIDRRILRELQKDGRLSNTELADRVGLTPSPCLRRVRQLEQDGVIRGYRALLDAEALGRGFHAFVTVVMRHEDHETIAEFERRVAELPEVVEAHRLFGDPDYLLRVAVADVAAYERFRSGALLDLPGVGRLTSHLAMKQVKADRGFPVGDR